jgi:hypothetical protein
LSPASVRRNHALVHASLGRAVRLATAIALAAVSGMRRGELCALRWSDVHPQRANVRVGRSLTTRGDQRWEGPHQYPSAPRRCPRPGYGRATGGTPGAAGTLRQGDRDGAGGRRIRTLNPRRWFTAVPACTLGPAYWRLAASSAYIPVSTICVISLRRQEGFRNAFMCVVDASGRTAMQSGCSRARSPVLYRNPSAERCRFRVIMGGGYRRFRARRSPVCLFGPR